MEWLKTRKEMEHTTGAYLPRTGNYRGQKERVYYIGYTYMCRQTLITCFPPFFLSPEVESILSVEIPSKIMVEKLFGEFYLELFTCLKFLKSCFCLISDKSYLIGS